MSHIDFKEYKEVNIIQANFCPWGHSVHFVRGERGQKSKFSEFQQCGILTSVDSDELVQPPLKLRNSK